MGEVQSTKDAAPARRDQIHQVSGSESRGACSLEYSPVRSANRPRRDSDRLRAMIVDDDATALQPVKRILESFGYRVTTAAGSAEAMADLSVKRYDLLVTDF